MTDTSKTLHDAALALLKTLGSGILVVAIGIFSAPNLDRAVAVGIAGIMALLAALAAAVQVFVPQISFRAWIGEPWGSLLDSFVHGFLGAFLTSIIGILNMPDLSTWHSLVVGALVGAFNAGLRAIQGSLQAGDERLVDNVGRSSTTSVGYQRRRVLASA